MSGLCTDAIFVSNSPITAEEKSNLSSYCSNILENNNTGYDFYMWKLGMESAGLSWYDEVILMNSSVYGPLFDMENVFSRMDRLECDFWGITECFQMQPHIQSYFLVFRKNVISSPAFLNFWGGILPYLNKLQVIQSYEVGLTQWLVESGFKAGVLCPLEQLGRHCRETGKRLRKKDNSSVKHASELLHIGIPFLKRDAVRNRKVEMTAVVPFLQKYGYPEHLINEQGQQKALKCPLCDSPGKVTYKGVRNFLNLHDNERYDYCRCSSSACGVLWRKGGSLTPPPVVVAPSCKSHHDLKLTVLPPAISKLTPGTLLEIGCGTAERLMKLRELGWDVTGYADNAESREWLSTLNIRTIQNTKSEVPELFDYILVTQGLEQTEDPRAFLTDCRRMLKVGGTLILRTPNANSLLLRIFQTYWIGFNAPSNRIIYTTNALRTILSQSNFKSINITTCTQYSGTRFLQSLESSLNKWTSQSIYPTGSSKFIKTTCRIFYAILNLFTRTCGDECMVQLSRTSINN